jgi:hypothetical protein
MPFICYSCIFLKGNFYFHVLIFLHRRNTIVVTPHSGRNPYLLLRFRTQSNYCNSKFTLCCCDSEHRLQFQVHSLLLRLWKMIATPSELFVSMTPDNGYNFKNTLRCHDSESTITLILSTKSANISINTIAAT